MPGKMSDDVTDIRQIKCQIDMSECMSEKMSYMMSDKMSHRTEEFMSDRMSEYIYVRIYATVGITRSKV